MSIWRIAWKSIRHRGLGSLLTVLSMALGVMMVVAVLMVYGVVSAAFQSNSSIGYNLLLGARGGSLQLTLNSVFYLSRPIETIPYEYLLAFQGKERRAAELKNSIAWRAMEQQQRTVDELLRRQSWAAGGGIAGLIGKTAAGMLARHQQDFMQVEARGVFANYTEYAVPILMGDYYEVPREDNGLPAGGPGDSFRVCATNTEFFSRLLLDIDSEEKFTCTAGRFFEHNDPECGLFGCVFGAVAARRSGIEVGTKIKITHGVPGEDTSHLHEQLFTVTGILAPTGTPNDRVVFVNMEGFYLIADHIKPVHNDSVLAAGNAPRPTASAAGLREIQEDEKNRTPLPIEQRELTSVLLSTTQADEFGALTGYLQPLVEGGDLERTLNWSSFRPKTAQTSVQAVNPISEIAGLFAYVDWARWLLLGLTVLICVVSGLSILVGIYNSMSQRHHEIAVMRALGASRPRVMLIILGEAVLLAVAGGLLGWIAGHLLCWGMSPLLEAQTGMQTSFWMLAPGGSPLGSLLGPLSGLFGNSQWAANLLQFRVSPELLLIPGLVLLAIVVGIYPAVSAYRTDVARSLGK
jgi:putative ABC transport system permease protein